MASSSKPENNKGNEAPQWPPQGITDEEVDVVPLSVSEFLLDQTPMLPMVEPFGVFSSPSTLSEAFFTNKGVFDHAFSEPRSGAEVDSTDVDPDAAAFADSVTLTQPPPSPPPEMTSVRPLGMKNYYVPDPPADVIPPPPPPPLHSSPSVSLPPPSQSIQQSTMTSITTDPSLSHPPSQSQTTTTSLPPRSPTPVPSPNQTLTSPSHHTIPSSSPPHPPPLSDKNQTIASPPQQSNQTTTSTPLPPLPRSQSVKPKVISPLSPSPSVPPSTAATTKSPPPVSHPATTPTAGAQPSPSAAAESTREMSSKRKRGRPRKEFAGERSGSSVEGRAEEALQEKKKRRKKKKNTHGEGEGEDNAKQPTPSFAAPASPPPLVLFNHPNSTVLGFSSCRNVIRPASIIASQNEDISAKIVSFAINNGAVFVLAASGQLSSLCYMEPSGIVQELTGVYEILSLSGTLLLSNEGEAPTRRSRTGYLNISVVGMDGKIIGGRVCGSMIAASPVQVVAGAIVAAASDNKDSSSSKPPSSDHQSEALLLELNKQISNLSQEWQARFLDTQTKAKQELEETRELLNQTRQELQETRLSLSTTQTLLMQLFERLNIVNPPPPPPPNSSTNNPPSSL